MAETLKWSKRDIKASKIIQKQLNDLQKGMESLQRQQDGQDFDYDSETEYAYECDQDREKKAKKWWVRLDEKHFRQVDKKEYVEARDLTTSNRMISIFSIEPRPIESFLQERLVPLYDVLEEAHFIHVLFKHQGSRYSCLTSFELEQAIPNYSDHKKQKASMDQIKITPMHKSEERDIEGIKEVRLRLAAWNDDEEVCRVIQHSKQNYVKCSNLSEIDRQIELWEKDLRLSNSESNVNWNQLIQNIRSTAPSPALDFSNQIFKIKEYLMWNLMLKYFEHGHSDKTQHMLQTLIDSLKIIRPSKSKEAANSKKFFQTDCKICFCSYNSDSNQVLYCDNCNTSFHLACYGLSEIPKQDKYFCDRCKHIKQHSSVHKTPINRITCQLCCKTSFPIKEIDKHFYHVTCLMLFNLIQINDGRMKLKNGITYTKICEMIVDSQIKQKQCKFCYHSKGGGQLGIKLSCSMKGCNVSVHPICAYLNGCKFNIKKNAILQKLSVEVQCDEHNPQRDFIEQTYIRRYMCNFNSTSFLKYPEFCQKYAEEIATKQENKKKKIGLSSTYRIMNKTKAIKMLENRARKVQRIQTETGKMLKDRLKYK